MAARSAQTPDHPACRGEVCRPGLPGARRASPSRGVRGATPGLCAGRATAPGQTGAHHAPPPTERSAGGPGATVSVSPLAADVKRKTSVADSAGSSPLGGTGLESTSRAGHRLGLWVDPPSGRGPIGRAAMIPAAPRRGEGRPARAARANRTRNGPRCPGASHPEERRAPARGPAVDRPCGYDTRCTTAPARLVPGGRVELPRACARPILSRVRLPFRHPGRLAVYRL